MKNILIGIVIVGALAGLFVYLSKPRASMDGSTDMTANLHISHGKLVDGPATLQVKKGDMVMLNVTNDEADEFHLHGYDKSVNLMPNKEAMLMLRADTAGRFPAELEHKKTDVFTLEVMP